MLGKSSHTVPARHIPPPPPPHQPCNPISCQGHRHYLFLVLRYINSTACVQIMFNSPLCNFLALKSMYVKGKLQGLCPAGVLGLRCKVCARLSRGGGGSTKLNSLSN